jgi:hypothetical protein
VGDAISIGKTGLFLWFSALFYEVRRIVIAEGIEFHDSDIGQYSVLGYLKSNQSKLSGQLTVDSSGKKAEYISHDQKVHYKLEVVHKKSEFKTALQTEGIIAIYAGHSRYGRGACFDQYTGAFSKTGDQWENGTTSENGLFRLAFPYVPVPEHEIRKHKYHFAPVPVITGSSSERPKENSRHPYKFERAFRWRTVRKLTLPSDLSSYVIPAYKSLSDQYYGFKKREGSKLVDYFILNAGWQNTQSKPNDLGATQLKCRTFCHFGCSSMQHYWDIVRRDQYKAWKRPKPPTEKFAYFTTAPGVAWHHWVFYLLKFSEENDPSNSGNHWWRSHQYAKRKANQRLTAEGERVRVY